MICAVQRPEHGPGAGVLYRDRDWLVARRTVPRSGCQRGGAVLRQPLGASFAGTVTDLPLQVPPVCQPASLVRLRVTGKTTVASHGHSSFRGPVCSGPRHGLAWAVKGYSHRMIRRVAVGSGPRAQPLRPSSFPSSQSLSVRTTALYRKVYWLL